jgi:predicted nucleic acid-binding protein
MISAGEIRKGALALGAKRQAAILANLDATPVYPIDQTVAVSYAVLWHKARQIGHGIQAKDHSADCWIAATAIALGVRLLTGDGLYRGAPGLSVEIIERAAGEGAADP